VDTFRLTLAQKAGRFIASVLGTVLGTAIAMVLVARFGLPFDHDAARPDFRPLLIGYFLGTVLGILPAILIDRPRLEVRHSYVFVVNRRSRHLPWSTIQAIEVKRRLGTATLRFHTTDGKVIAAGAPVTGFLVSDRAFGEKVNVVRQAWSAARVTCRSQDVADV